MNVCWRANSIMHDLPFAAFGGMRMAAAHCPRPISHHRSTRPGERNVTDMTETQNFVHTLVYLWMFGVPILMALTWLGSESYLRALDANAANAQPRASILRRLAALLPVGGRDGRA
jgi:hypothetical protein